MFKYEFKIILLLLIIFSLNANKTVMLIIQIFV